MVGIRVVMVFVWAVGLLATGEVVGATLSESRDAALRTSKPGELAKLCVEISARRTPQAKDVVIEILANKNCVSLLCGLIPNEFRADRTIFAPKYYIGQVLDAVVSDWPDAAEQIILVDLNKAWGPIFIDKNKADSYMKAMSRVVALGLTSHPTDELYVLLERLGINQKNTLHHFAYAALLRLGDDKSKAILSKIGRREWTQSGNWELLSDAQHVRTKPAMFELLIETYRLVGRKPQASKIIQAIVTPKHAVGYPPASRLLLPAYRGIEKVSDVIRILRALDGLLEKPGTRSLTGQEKASLLVLKTELLAVKEKLSTKASNKKD